MPSVKFDGTKGELRIELEGLSEAECYQAFLTLGEFLGQFSDIRCACLGHTIVEELTSKKHDRFNSGAVLPTPCLFCVIAAKEQAASEGKGEPPKACPF